jgi:hypothetical protein
VILRDKNILTMWVEQSIEHVRKLPTQIPKKAAKLHHNKQ